MSETNMSDKIAETITTIIKKTQTYEKTKIIGNIMMGISVFCVINCALSSFNYFSIQHIIFYNYNQYILHKKEIDSINVKLDKLIDKKPYGIDKSCSTSDLDIIYEEEHHDKYDIIVEDDDELLNECYDIIPCNNNKKVTQFRGVFGW